MPGIRATIIFRTRPENFRSLREDNMEQQNTHDNDSLTLSQIFHEIKNPLTLINSSLQFIESDHPEVKTFRFWNQTMEDMKGLRLLLDDLSDFQKGSVLKITELSAFDFIDELLDSIEAFLLEAGIPLILEEPSEDFTFSADGTKLRQAVINLLKNAAESSAPGNPVTLSIGKENETFFIRVSDHGCGISEEALPKLFEPFHTTKSYGTGLGLPIVKRIVSSHHGTISVDSAENSGTAFHINIPFHVSY